MTDLIILLPALIGAGLAAGLIAGLFGIGGGVIIVPTLAFLFTALGYGEVSMHMAVGCSLATIVATSIRSAQAHHKRGAVDMAVVRSWAPWIMLGGIAGAVLAGQLPGEALRGVFGVITLLVAAQFFFGRPDFQLATDLPGAPLKQVIASGLGGLSAIMGIGGGVFGVTLMTLCGRSVHQAIGTAAAFGAAIGFPAALTYIATGFGLPDRPPLSLGYLNGPAIMIIALLTTTMAPVGARLAHSMDGQRLKQIFAIVLALLAVRMIWSGFTGG